MLAGLTGELLMVGRGVGDEPSISRTIITSCMWSTNISTNHARNVQDLNDLVDRTPSAGQCAT